MKIKKLKIIITFISCLIFNQALAGLLENGSLDQINNSGAFGIAGLDLDYKEIFYSSDAALDGAMPKSAEAGIIPGIFFDIRTTFWGKIYTSLYLDYYGGKLKYDGAEKITLPIEHEGKLYSYNSYKPLEFKAAHKFFDVEVKPGYIFTLNFTDGYALQVIPYVGVGYHYWNRGSDHLNYEKYQNFKTIAGIRFNLQLSDDFIFSPYIEGGKIFSANMKQPHYDLSVTLGNKPIYTGGLELNYKIFDEFFLNGFASYTQFKYGISESKVCNNGVSRHEPDSKTKEIKFGLGVRYSWLVN